MNIKLFCFPFAGGTANVFIRWQLSLDPSIICYPVELAGRGKRMKESVVYNNMDDFVADLYNQISKEIENSTYAFFGHSLGAYAAFELAHTIKKCGLPPPVHLFLSGQYAPQYNKYAKKIYHLPEDEFINEIIDFGGTSPELFENEELKTLFMPILRIDLKIADTYCPAEKRSKFDFDFTILYGKEDPLLTEENIHGWREHTTGGCRIIEFDGNHMYLLEKTDEVIKVINQVLTKGL